LNWHVGSGHDNRLRQCLVRLTRLLLKPGDIAKRFG